MKNSGRTVYRRSTEAMHKFLNKECTACAGPYPNITGMRNKYWGNGLIVKCGRFAYLMPSNWNNNPDGIPQL